MKKSQLVRRNIDLEVENEQLKRDLKRAIQAHALAEMQSSIAQYAIRAESEEKVRKAESKILLSDKISQLAYAVIDEIRKV